MFFKIKTYSISDYLFVCKLLTEAQICKESELELLTTRIANHATSVRKIIGNFDCIVNEEIPTLGSYFERYRINLAYRDEFASLKQQYEANPKFMRRLHKRFEKIGRKIGQNTTNPAQKCETSED